MDEFTDWWLDEYDGPRFRKFVNVNGPSGHEDDPLATAVGPCWIWTGTKGEGGYGQFRMGPRMVPAHRIAWLDGGRKNTIPEGHVIDHLCRNAPCVNPQHLEPVSQLTNVQRGLRSREEHPNCPNGHPYSEENTKYEKRRGIAYRYCRICLKASRHETYLRRRAQGKCKPPGVLVDHPQ